ncbi:MAG TPA: NADP-dependent oxidoreductase [Gammaproteobacteria bacterium]|nr:NADP-dependent oxidoreductase [Gammaproteobacteria bacterium]
MSERNHEIRLAVRPRGWPDQSNFEYAEVPVPEPADGEVLVRNIYMSVDPYMRGRMNDVKSYVPPFQVGKPLEGHAIGQVVRSRSSELAEGDLVSSMYGWREYFAAPPSPAGGMPLMKVDPDLAPLPAYLGVLGMPGLTAYAGLLEIGQPSTGETVLVSAASGAVGSVVGQIARIKGCRAVGMAGSDEKVHHLTDELGFDEAFNYKTDDLNGAIAHACPDGVDVYFENVGGRILEAALMHMRPFGRIPVCGMISLYNLEKLEPGPASIIQIIPNRLRMQGFIVSDHFDLMPRFQQDMAGWIRDGRIKHRETIEEGLENAPRAFLDMMHGKNVGKMVVRVSDDPTA